MAMIIRTTALTPAQMDVYRSLKAEAERTQAYADKARTALRGLMAGLEPQIDRSREEWSGGEIRECEDPEGNVVILRLSPKKVTP